MFDFPYIIYPELTGDLKNDAVCLLTTNGREAVAMHCVKVAEMCADLAVRFKLDKTAAFCSGILHDVSAVVNPRDMIAYAEKNGWYIDDSERKYNSILHQRISEVIAKDYFCVTTGCILSAIRCHSTLTANASEYDMALFLADKISWDQQGEPPYLHAVQDALNTSLTAASLAYINYALDHHMILIPHKWLLEAKAWLEQSCE
jgi:predicted HD superfamily hydrolase involved in NAD metabolism